PLFDTCFYLSRYFPSGLNENPFVHYLKKGLKEGLQPGPFLDADFYRNRSDWQESDPLTHYTHHGAAEGISPGPYFDVDYFLDKNPVLAGMEKEIVKHYKLHGAVHGKSPVSIFDPEFYLDQLENAEHARRDPLSHYLSAAEQTNFRPAEWFDPDYYIEHIGTNIHRLSVLAHYLSSGCAEKRYTDERVAELPEKPLISIIVPVYNPDIRFLNNCIRSVLYQVYPHWELCLADDCSQDGAVRSVLREWIEKDSRIKLTLLEKNHGISGATNAAAQLATGQFLGFLDNDDELSPDCLYHVAQAIYRHEADLIYTDENLIGDDGSNLSVFRKPAFNEELLLSHNYITHFVTVSKALFDQVGGLDSSYDGAQDFDLLLKLSEQATTIHHIPKILYHWRAVSTSTSINHDEKEYAHEAGKRALGAAIRRRELLAEVADGDVSYHYRLKYSVPQIIKVSVLVWSECFVPDDIDRLVRELSKTSYIGVEYCFVSDNPDIVTWIKNSSKGSEMASGFTHHCVAAGISRAQGLHEAVSSCESDVVVFLDAAISSVTDDWLDELLGPFCLDDVAVVCGRLYYDGGDGRSFALPDISDGSLNYYQAFLNKASQHLNGLHCLQQVSFCGWEVTMIDRDFYLAIEGLEWSRFPSALSMADLSMKVQMTGKKIVYTPYARVHTVSDLQKSKQESENVSILDEEKVRFAETWGHELQRLDQFYNIGVLIDNRMDTDRFEHWFSGVRH
ncbi:MAG: glycosyltransferase, partial [Desulforhopalus sp.]